MARALAIETSGRVGSIAVVDESGVLAEEQFPHGLQHAAQIIPIIDRLCRVHNWHPRDIERLYVSAGPGSFTGLRIGITLAKTLSLALGTKIVAVPTVRALVENAPEEAQHVIIVLDAKRGQIFTARFDRNEDDDRSVWREVEPAHLDDLASMLSRAPRPVYLLGEGIAHHQTVISGDDLGVKLTDQQAWRARASVVARIGTDLAQHGKFADPLTLTPTYIRRPEAEEKWKG